MSTSTAAHLQHVVGHERHGDKILVTCSEGDLRIALDSRTGSTARARRYGDEHRAIVKRVAELQAAGR